MIEVIPILNIFKDKITNFVGERGEELAQQLDKSFMVYTKNWYDKISEVKTFLFQDQKVKFEDIYFPISIKINIQGNESHG